MLGLFSKKENRVEFKKCILPQYCIKSKSLFLLAHFVYTNPHSRDVWYSINKIVIASYFFFYGWQNSFFFLVKITSYKSQILSLHILSQLYFFGRLKFHRNSHQKKKDFSTDLFQRIILVLEIYPTLF